MLQRILHRPVPGRITPFDQHTGHTADGQGNDRRNRQGPQIRAALVIAVAVLGSRQLQEGARPLGQPAGLERAVHGPRVQNGVGLPLQDAPGSAAVEVKIVIIPVAGQVTAAVLQRHHQQHQVGAVGEAVILQIILTQIAVRAAGRPVEHHRKGAAGSIGSRAHLALQYGALPRGQQIVGIQHLRDVGSPGTGRQRQHGRQQQQTENPSHTVSHQKNSPPTKVSSPVTATATAPKRIPSFQGLTGSSPYTFPVYPFMA